MANFKNFSDVEELSTITGTVSVITVEPGPLSVIPEAIIIEKYVDGEKLEGSEERFETSDISTDILDADLEPEVYISNEAEGLYDAMVESAEMFKEANCNIDVYAEMVEEKIKAEADFFDEEEE